MLVHVGTARVESMRIHCLRYGDDSVTRSDTTIIAECVERVHQREEGERLWLRVVGLHEVEEIGERLTALGEQLMSDPIAVDIRSVHGPKAEILQVQRLIRPSRELVGHLERGESPLVAEGNRIYFRDLYDHTLRCVEDIDVLRESINGLRDYYLSAVSNRMNEVMKVLACISTILLPLTFLAGVYGMNFHRMPELGWRWGYPALLCVFFLAASVMFYLFRKNKWL